MINTTHNINNINGSSEHILINTTTSKHSSCRSNFSIGTLNCRGLRKTANPATSAAFIRYLRTVSVDILALQETHVNTEEIAQLFKTQFQTHTSYWSNYCGIVCFSPFLSLSEPTWDTIQRTLTVKISHVHESFDPVFITVVYIPADTARRHSYLQSSLLNPQGIFDATPARHILLGDFNYSYNVNISPHNYLDAPLEWLEYIAEHYIDSIIATGQTHQPTFHRGSSSSCIDYIFVSRDLASSCLAPTYRYIQPCWSDHMLLSLPLHLTTISRLLEDGQSPPSLGKGIWRAHPRLAASRSFRDQLRKAVSAGISSFPYSMSVQCQWDAIKVIAKREAQRYSRHQTFSLTNAEKILQHKRSAITKRILDTPAAIPQLSPQLRIVEHQLASIQQYHVDNLALRSGLRWREHGEISAGYLKRTVAQRQHKKLFKAIKHPQTSILCTSKDSMLEAARQFYADLYRPDSITHEAVDDLLSSIPSDLTLPTSDQYWLASSNTWDDLLEGVSRCPKRSSPGIDGLPYEILRLLFSHPACKALVLQVYNDALLKGIFPDSWLHTSVSLLPKKGDLTDLKNWRPISLINTDAKVFTRIINARIVSCADMLITPLQSGFLHGRFIADNGLMMKLVMAHARSSDSTAIGLLLDQEKAYDRVHPEYLQRVLQHFGFPPVLVQCIANLFFGSSLHININGHLSQPVPQLRGLRQGDPLSPVLFNLAFEPLLRRIIHDQAFQGFSFPRSLAAPAQLDHNIKLLAYADDIACFLQSPTDLRILNNHLATYSAASNARINFHKTEAFALSGKHSIFHSTWRTPLTQSNIHAWHDCNAPEPIVYLGYPIFHNSRQRNVFQDRLLKKIENACNVHNHRSLSFRGRVTIANCLVLSKLWYVLRVVSVTKQFLSSVVSIVAKFITARCFPKISFATMTVPRKLGGLGLLNPFIQQSALQLRWLIPLLRHSHLSPEFWCSEELTSSIVLPLLADYLIHLVEISMRLPEPVALGSDFRLPFLFPSLRPLRSKDREHPLYLLYQAIDALPKDFSTVVINPETAMHIPLGSIINPIRNFPLRPSILKLPASSAYIIDSEFNFTRPRSNLEIVQSPRLVKMFLKAIRDGHLQLAPFFLRTCIAQSLAHLASPAYIPVLHHNIDVSRFIKACTLAPSGKDISSKEFRKLCRPPTPESPPSLSSTKWLSFWRFPIHLQARTVWYRVLHGKLATRSTLFKLLPELVDSPQCAVCTLSAIEDTDHFLYDCPPKMLLWKELWPTLFSSQFSASLLKKALFKLEFPDSSLETEIPSAVGIASILLSIWRAHFNLVFNLQPFIPSTVVSLTRSVLLTYSREHLLQSGGSPFPLPHFCL